MAKSVVIYIYWKLVGTPWFFFFFLFGRKAYLINFILWQKHVCYTFHIFSIYLIWYWHGDFFIILYFILIKCIWNRWKPHHESTTKHQMRLQSNGFERNMNSFLQIWITPISLHIHCICNFGLSTLFFIHIEYFRSFKQKISPFKLKISYFFPNFSSNYHYQLLFFLNVCFTL